jgi:heme/copper-type cytochrome/quinol oxidase subunit 3
MKLFIFSEVIFFSGFFASLFYTIFSGEVCCGMTFPPQKALALDPYRVPLLNTALLLSSGVTVTWGHGGLSGGDARVLRNGLLLSTLLGVVFIVCQGYEYVNCDFTMSSGIYGSNFFALTGFHGFHVTVGMIGLGVCWTRSLMRNTYFGKGARCDCFI